MTRSRILAVPLVAVGLLGTFAFGTRNLRSAQVLISAYEVGIPALSSVRPWMTAGYVAETYRVPLQALAGKLHLPADTPSETLLRDIAVERGIGVFDTVRLVQTAIAELTTGVRDDAPAPGETSSSLTDAQAPEATDAAERRAGAQELWTVGCPRFYQRDCRVHQLG